MTGGMGVDVGDEVGVIVAVGEILVGVFVVAGGAVSEELQADIMIMQIAKIKTCVLFITNFPVVRSCSHIPKL